MSWDADKAAARCSSMWIRLASALEKYAHACVEKGLPETAVKSARLADVALWHATGEIDSLTWKDVLPGKSDD
jgi:hypothetical protein